MVEQLWQRRVGDLRDVRRARNGEVVADVDVAAVLDDKIEEIVLIS